MAEITVDVGVRLKAMQSSVADLQKVLDGLQPNSSGFKALQRIIADINRDIDRLRIQTSKPFGSQNQFNQTEKTVDKLEESLEKVKITIDRIKFSDLKLDSSQTAQLDNFKKQLKDIKQEFTDFKADLKGQFLDNDFNKAFVEGINPNLLNKSFDEIVKNVENRVNSLGSTLAKAKAELEEFKNASKLGERISKASQATNGVVSPEVMGQEMFDKFFQTNSKGVFSFKTGGGLKKGEIQQQFLDYLASEFQLNQSQIDQLKNQTASNIRKILAQEDFFNPQKGAAETANKKMDVAESAFTSASKNYENAAAVVARLTPLLSALSNEELSLEDKQKLVNEAIRQFEQDCVNGAKGSKTLQDSTKGLSSGLESFKQQLSQVNAQWLNLQKQQATFNSMKSAIVNFMGFNQVLNLTKKAVKEAMDHIKQLDTVMNGIAIVTDMTTADLWNQVDVYSEMAQRYGTSIQGAYEVSKIYYQAGYETNEVLTLMNETLKMSKISGLDYATTTDYMMNAIKGFKMEVTDAASVVDVYSALAANTAVSQQELAEAMSKTASSMAGVGSTFEDTSAMIATMVSVTRESANNIGSAMKSIASRYGELTKDPTKLLDSEGEAMSFNKVDTALKSVGITLQTTDHQFRDFTDVIVELADKWDTLDSAQQRYIATQFAGNRQQNRFLALVSNKDLLQENMEVAAASEDTGTLQALKALDSLESKLNQVQVAYQQFYTTIGVEGVWKAFLDGTKNVIDTLNNLPKLFGKVPLGAVAVIYDIISLIKNVALKGLEEIASIWIQKTQEMTAQTQSESGKNRDNGTAWVDNFVSGISSGIDKIRQVAKEAVDAANEEAYKKSQEQKNQATSAEDNYYSGLRSAVERFDAAISPDEELDASIALAKYGLSIEDARAKLEAYTNTAQKTSEVTEEAGQAALSGGQRFLVGAQGIAKAALSSKKLASTTSGLAMGLNTIAMLINTTSESGKLLAGTLMTVAGGLRAVGAVLQYVGSAGQMAFPWMAVITGVIGIVNGISTAYEDAQEKLERLQKEAEDSKNAYIIKKDNLKSFDNAIKKYEELEKKQYDGVEAREAFLKSSNDIAEQFPELISGYDSEGNAIVDLTNKYELLALKKAEAAEAGLKNAGANVAVAEQTITNLGSDIRDAVGKIQNVGDIELGKAAESVYNSANTSDFFEQFENFSFSQFQAMYNHLGVNIASQDEFMEEISNIFTTISNLEENMINELKESFPESSDFIDQIRNSRDFDSYISSQDLTAGNQALKDFWNDEIYGPYQAVLTELASQKDLSNIFKTGRQALIEYNNVLEKLEQSKEGKTESEIKAIQTTIDNFKQTYDSTNQQIQDIIDNYGEYNIALNTLDTANKDFIASNVYSEYVNSLMNADDIQNNIWQYYEKSSQGVSLLNKRLWDSYQAGLENNQWEDVNQFLASQEQDGYRGIIDSFNESFGTFWNSASDSTREAFNTYYNNLGNYTREQAEQIATNMGLDFDATGLAKSWEDSDVTQRVRDALKARKSNENLAMLKEAGNLDFIPSVLEEQFKSVADIVNGYSREGLFANAYDLGINYVRLVEAIQENAEENSSEITSLLSDMDLSFSGISKLKEILSKEYQINDGPIIEALDGVSDTLVENITAQIASLQEGINSNLKDVTSNLEKMGSGLKYSDALSIFEKIRSKNENINFTDLFNFDLDLGKYVATSADVIQKYLDAEEAVLRDNEEHITAVLEAANSFTVPHLTTETWQEQIDQEGYRETAVELGLQTYIDEIEAAQKSIDEKNTPENQQRLLKAVENYNKAWNLAVDKNTADLAAASEALGNVTSASQLKSLLNTQEYDKYLKTIGVNTNTKDFIAAGDKSIAGSKAFFNQINSVYDNLISDVLSKGFENIHLEDYKDLIKGDDTAIKEAIQFGNYSYEQFIRDYGYLTSKSIEETNSLIIQAIEKDAQATTGAVAEVVGKIQWLSDKKGFASLGDIQSLADALGISVDAILGEYNKQLDAYEVDVSQIDLSNVDNFRESVYDSINEFLKSITDEISKGISGKLSGADVTSLNGQLAQLGIEGLGKTDFTETAEGLKISQRAAIDLYTELKKIDALQGQLVFEDLAKSLEANDTNYTNISTTLARIAELEKAIKEMKPDDAKLQMYKNELAVAQEIARTRSSTDNKDFNFMDRALPTGMQNPIDYWNATGAAYKAINASAKSGYMEIQDFYNIVQEMSNMAQVSGQTLHFMGQEIDGSAEAAASLIQRGFSALTNVKGDGVKIALGNIGADFKTGAADMKGDFDSGIKEMAKSQIQMLDAAINMLEAIVAMEDIDLDQDGLLEIGEIFNPDYTFTDKVDNWFTELDNLTGGIEIGGVDLKTALLNMAAEGDEGRQKVVDLLNQLYNIDWTLGDVNVFAQIQGILQAFYPGENITQGKSIFELLEIPKNADKNSEEFKKWATDIGLSVDMADLLIQKLTLSEGHIADKGSEWYTAIEKTLGLAEKGQEKIKTIFEQFTGDTLETKELKFWQNINIEDDGEGNLTEATYQGSDGGSINLDLDNPLSWAKQIEDYEYALQKARQLGGKTVTTKDNETFTFSSQIGMKQITVVTTGSGENATTTYRFPNGFETEADSLSSAALAYANDLKAKDVKGTIYGDKSAEDILIELGYIVKESSTVEFNKEGKTPEEQAQEVLEQDKQKLQDSLDSAEKTFNEVTGKYDWKVTLPNGNEIEFSTDGAELSADQLAQKALEAMGLDSSLITAISTAITTAFTQDTSIGEAIGQGIRTALTSGMGEDGQSQDIPLPTLNLKPESITIQAGEIIPTITGIDENNNLPIPSITVEAQKVLLTSTIEPNSDGLNIPTSIPKEDLSIIYSALNLIGYKENVNESGVYLPAILEKHPVMAAYLAMLLLMSNSDTNYNETFVDNPSENLEKKFEAAAILAKLVLSSDENTDFVEGSISVGEGKQLKIKQVLEAIATGKIKINSPENGSSIEQGNIIIGEGENQLTLSQIEWITAIDAIKAELGSNYQVIKTGVTLTEDDLTLDPKELIQPISGIRYINNFQKSREKVGLNNDWDSIDNNNKLGKDLVTSKNNDYLNYLEETAKYVGKGGILTSVDWTYLNPLKEMSDVTIPESVLTTLQSIDGLDLTNVKLENSQDLFNLLVQLQQFNESNSSSFSSITDSLNTLEVGELPEISIALQDIVAQAQLLEAINWQTIIDGINGVTKANLVTKPNSNNPEETGNTSSNSTQTVVVEVEANTEKADEKITSLNSSIEDEVKKKPVDIDDSAAQTTLSNLESAIQATVNKYADIYINYTQQYKDALADITKDVDKTVNIKTKGTVNTGPGPKAGNVALTTGTGNAYSAGNTLMGELGPEMVVSHGRYFVVGQNGPEMVNLAEDAIVFNHLQTEQLLRHGKASGHAKPVTNERKATSLATGNVGPAMASASAALDALKQLRAMWQSLLNASLKDLGGLAGGSGGGGGGGGGGNDEATKGVLGNIERWYNYLQLIESTQVKINKLTKEYTLLEKQGISSNTRLDNLKKEYDLLKENKENREKLVEEQTNYRKELLKQVQTGKGKYGLLSAFYDGNAEDGTFTLKNDKAFQEFVKKRGTGKTLKGKGIRVQKRSFYSEEEAEEKNKEIEKYNKDNEEAIKKGEKKVKKTVKAGDVKGSKKSYFKATGGLELFDELQKTDQYGNLVYSADDQLKILEDLGFGTYLKKDASGNKLKTAEEKVEYFFSQIESGKGEIDALTDSINDQTQAALDDAISMQEINEQIREIYQTVPGVNEGLDKWYNYTRKIADEQNRLNKLTKENANLQKDQIGNGQEIYENYKQQLASLENSAKLNDNYLKAREKEADNLAKNAGSLMNLYTKTDSNSYIFNESSLKALGPISYQTEGKIKTNKLGYEVDEKGQYVDDKGVLRDKKGKEVKDGEYGQTQVKGSKEKTFNTSGNIVDVINRLTAQDATGKVALAASEQYQIIKQLGLEEFIKYDENGSQIYSNFGEMSKEDQQKAVEVGINRIRETITELNENNDEIAKLEESNLDINSQILDVQNTLRDNSINVQNMMRDAIVQEHQDAIDQKKELTDAIKNAADKTISGLKDSLEKEKNVYDSDQDEKELTLLQMQLSTARVSGNAASKVLDLQKQIAEKQKEIYFNERQTSINDLEDATNKQVEELEEQTNIMQSVLDYQVKYGHIWKEVNQKLAENSTEAIVDYILKNSPDYVKANIDEQTKTLITKLDTVGIYKSQKEDEKQNQQAGTPSQQPEVPTPTTDGAKVEDSATKKKTAVQNALNNLKTNKDFKDIKDAQKLLSSKEILKVANQAYDNSKATNDEDRQKAVEKAVHSAVDKKLYSFTFAGVWKDFQTKNSGLLSQLDEDQLKSLKKFSRQTYNSSKKKTLEGKAQETMSKTLKRLEDLVQQLKNRRVTQYNSNGVPISFRKYASGGEINFTGPAWVDGSKTKPEQIFNFEQMKQLKTMFLDNLATTQMGILGLSSITDNLPNTNSYNSINNEDNGVSINQLDFHMEVQEIGDGYDARQAGREAMEEIVRIARKSGNRSISRR